MKKFIPFALTALFAIGGCTKKQTNCEMTQGDDVTLTLDCPDQTTTITLQSWTNECTNITRLYDGSPNNGASPIAKIGSQGTISLFLEEFCP